MRLRQHLLGQCPRTLLLIGADLAANLPGPRARRLRSILQLAANDGERRLLAPLLQLPHVARQHSKLSKLLPMETALAESLADARMVASPVFYSTPTRCLEEILVALPQSLASLVLGARPADLATLPEQAWVLTYGARPPHSALHVDASGLVDNRAPEAYRSQLIARLVIEADPRQLFLMDDAENRAAWQRFGRQIGRGREVVWLKACE